MRYPPRLHFDAEKANLFATTYGPSDGKPTTLKRASASKGRVKLVSAKPYTLCWLCATLSLGCLIFCGLAVAQTTKEASSAEIVSPKSEAKAEAAIEPRTPSITEEADDNSVAVDPATLLPELPPVPKANATMIGGTVDRVDRVRDRITVRVFGGGKENILFDPRTHIYRGGQPVTQADLHEGERIYLDTILDGSDVFARTIRLTGPRATGTSQGTVLKFRSDRGQLTVRDALSPEPVEVRVNSSTRLTQGDRTLPITALVPGSLVSIRFSSGQGPHNTATEISILAQPGTEYTFSGQVVHIDLRNGLVVVNSSVDHKMYELYLASPASPDENLHPGATVTAITRFDGEHYVVRSMSVNPH